jgi:histidinol-phosphate aminotransferase
MAALFDAPVIEVPDPRFRHDLDAMAAAITPRTREIFITNPNNPTGTMVSQEEIDRFMDIVPDHVVVIFDEAYYEFVDNPSDTLKFIREGRENVVVLRTFSKIQGLAGLRIGYGLGAKSIIGVLQKTRQPFNANSIAQAGAIAGLADTEHQRKTKAITDEGRRLLEDSFSKMGLRYVPSAANFVLVHVGDGGQVFQRLMKKGIIVRSMVSYHLPAYIRVSVGTPEQNARFLAELPEALEGLGAFTRLGANPPERPAPTPISPPDPGPDKAPERVPTPDPTPNPDHDPLETDPEPEPESEPMPEPFRGVVSAAP